MRSGLILSAALWLVLPLVAAAALLGAAPSASALGTHGAAADLEVGWVGRYAGAATYMLNAVCFPDADHGWAVSSRGEIISSSDGGVQWVAQASGSAQTLLDVCFTDATHGWAVGGGGTILVTSDGGANWSAQASGTGTTLIGVSFPDGLHGWAVGQTGVILATSDGGANWSAQASGTNVSLNSVCFPDVTHGWAVGHEGTILVTSDGGAHWSAQASGTGQWFQHVSFPDAVHGWAVGGGGTIMATSDGGNHWRAQNSGYGQDIWGVVFPDATHGWAIVPYYDTILATADGGAHWVAQADCKSYDLSFPDESHGCAVGYQSNYPSGPTILTTANGGWPAPTVTGLSPGSGPVGTSVAITGTGLAGYSDVKFGTVSSPSVRIDSGTQITATVPAGFASGAITVTTDGGSATSAASFTVTKTPVVTVTAPTASSSWPSNTEQTVSWGLDRAAASGEFRVWLVSSGGTWYVNKQVAVVPAQTAYSTVVRATVPPGQGYKAYVYWRATAGTGAWTAQGRSAGFTIVDGPPLITVTAPVASSSWPSGSTQVVSWKLSNAAPGGEFKVWLVGSGGAWYVGKQVLPVGGQLVYSANVSVACPAGSYQAYVYWRPTVGSGAWAQTSRGAAFTVTPLNITSPNASSNWKLGSAQVISWTMNPAVTVGEFKLWLVGSGGTWYLGKVVTAVGGQIAYNAPITVSAPGMTSGSYRAYVYYRPTVGSGSWTITMIGASFSVVP